MAWIMAGILGILATALWEYLNIAKKISNILPKKKVKDFTDEDIANYKKCLGFLDQFVKNFDYKSNEYQGSIQIGFRNRPYNAYWEIENFKCSLIESKHKELKSSLEDILKCFNTASGPMNLCPRIKPKDNFNKKEFSELLQKIIKLLK